MLLHHWACDFSVSRGEMDNITSCKSSCSFYPNHALTRDFSTGSSMQCLHCYHLSYSSCYRFVSKTARSQLTCESPFCICDLSMPVNQSSTSHNHKNFKASKMMTYYCLTFFGNPLNKNFSRIHLKGLYKETYGSPCQSVITLRVLPRLTSISITQIHELDLYHRLSTI